MDKEEKAIKSKENFRNRISSVDDKGKHIFVFPRLMKGRFFRYRSWFSWLLLVLLFAGPFIQIDGHPLFLFNVFERKFILFGTVFWPQDFIIFLLLVISFIIFIMLFTVAFGRLFCGWACPQTVFLEMVFRKIERLIDGNHIQQKKLYNAPWNAEKIKKRSLKYSIFIFIAFLIGNLLMAYIVGAEETISIITSPPAEHLSGFMVVMSFTGITFFNFAYFREQVCTVVCPYGRLQGVLLDKKSVVVTYDHQRGEPREFPRKNRSEEAGDCIDCFACVEVCPTGIDIRNGTQLECVNCTACIDACDEIMDKVKKPRGLIRYDSEEGVETGKSFRFNARTMAYSIVLTALLIIVGVIMWTRPEVQATITKARGSLYHVSADNYVKNLYNVNIANKTYESMPVNLRIPQEWNGRLKVIGNELEANPNQVSTAIFYLEIPLDKLENKSTDIPVEVWSNDRLIDEVDVRFLRP